MKHDLSFAITYKNVLKFVFPTVIMMMFTSLYVMVDGIFVSNLISTDALAAINIAYPVLNVVLGVSVMLATGGNAVYATLLGQGEAQASRQAFTFLAIFGAIAGAVIGVFAYFGALPVVILLGAEGNVVQYAYDYLSTTAFFMPFWLLQFMFQSAFSAAGRPRLGLILTVLGGVSNIVLDYVFLVIFDMGIVGTSIATGFGYLLPVVCGIYIFGIERKGHLYFVKPVMQWRALFRACANGFSEMITQLASALVALLYNIAALRLGGADAVASVAILMFAQYALNSFYSGYANGTMPLISYNNGSGNHEKLHQLYRMSLRVLLTLSITVFLASCLLGPQIVSVFAQSGTVVYDLASQGMRLFIIAFLFSGFNIFTCRFFAGFSNGKIPVIIAFSRTCACLVFALLVFPNFIGLTGVWIAVPFAEIVTILLSIYFVRTKREVYHYGAPSRS